MAYGEQLNLDDNNVHTVVLRNGTVCNVYECRTQIKKLPVYFNKDGTVKTLSHGLAGNNSDYDIVQILQEPLPSLPKGYKWAGGWPTLREIKNDEYYLTNYPENYGTYYGADIHKDNDLRGHKRIALEKIEAPPTDVPKENPEEYVIQNIVPCRPSDMCWYTSKYFPHIPMGDLWRADIKASVDFLYPVGKKHGETVSSENFKLNVFCKRKNLPVPTPQYPIYYLYNPEQSTTAKFVIRTSDNTCSAIGHDGKPHCGVQAVSWGVGEERAVRDGRYKLSSKEEYDKWLASLTIKGTEHTTVQQYPLYYKLKNNSGTKFVVRTSRDQCIVLRDNRNKIQSIWDHADDRSVQYGDYIPSSKEEYEAALKTLVPPPMYGVKPLELKADITFNTRDFVNCRDVTPQKSKSRAALDYFVVEPSVNMARAAVNSLRYILLVSVISTIGYCVTRPSEFKKALPKINFKIEKPEILE